MQEMQIKKKKKCKLNIDLLLSSLLDWQHIQSWKMLTDLGYRDSYFATKRTAWCNYAEEQSLMSSIQGAQFNPEIFLRNSVL